MSHPRNRSGVAAARAAKSRGNLPTQPTARLKTNHSGLSRKIEV